MTPGILEFESPYTPAGWLGTAKLLPPLGPGSEHPSTPAAGMPEMPPELPRTPALWAALPTTPCPFGDVPSTPTWDVEKPETPMPDPESPKAPVSPTPRTPMPPLE